MMGLFSMFVAFYAFLNKLPSQLLCLPLLVKELFEIKSVWGRTVVMNIFKPLAGFYPCWYMMIIYPPGNIRRPFRLQEPLPAILKGFTMSVAVRKGIHRF